MDNTSNSNEAYDAAKKWDEVLKTIEEGRILDLGKYYSYTIDHDIKHLGFVLARYKFASKMMENRSGLRVLELGCSYGLGSPYFLQTKSVQRYVGVDLDDEAIAWANKTFGSERVAFINEDFLGNVYWRNEDGCELFDAVVSIDVIEHIIHDKEELYLQTICDNLSDNGFALIGTPNITMKPFASAASEVGHVNLFDQKRLYNLLSRRFSNVFMFGMTDEVIHTGFYPFCCYIFALCTNKKR